MSRAHANTTCALRKAQEPGPGNLRSGCAYEDTGSRRQIVQALALTGMVTEDREPQVHKPVLNGQLDRKHAKKVISLNTSLTGRSSARIRSQ